MVEAVKAAADPASLFPGTVQPYQQQPGEASAEAASQAASDEHAIMRRLLRMDHFELDLASSTISALNTAHQCALVREESSITCRQLDMRLCLEPHSTRSNLVMTRLDEEFPLAPTGA